MRLATSMELYAYWNALRAGRSAPERNDIEPGAIRGILADTFVLDFDKENGFPFRIAGSRANALFLTELRGLSFLLLWREADRQKIKSDYSACGERIPAHPPVRGGRAARTRAASNRDDAVAASAPRLDPFPRPRMHRRQRAAALARPYWRRPRPAHIHEPARFGQTARGGWDLAGGRARLYRPERPDAPRASPFWLARRSEDLTPSGLAVDPLQSPEIGKRQSGSDVEPP